MNPFFLKGLSNWILVIGCIFTLLGTIGSLYFGRRVGKIEPYLKPIRSANSTVELILKSNHINDVEAIHHVDQGAVIGFFKDEQELLACIIHKLTFQKIKCQIRPQK